MPALALQHRPDFENIFPAEHPLAKRGNGEQMLPLSPESPRLQAEALKRIVFFHSLFRRRMSMITHHTPGGGAIIHLDTHLNVDTHQTIIIPPTIQERTRTLAMANRNRILHTLYNRTSTYNNFQTNHKVPEIDHNVKDNHAPTFKKHQEDESLPEKQKPDFKVLYVRPNTKEVPAMLQLPAHNPSEKPTALSA